MKTHIKKFDVEMELKNNGMEIELRDNDNTFKGDVFVTKTGLTWCKGKTTKKNGIEIGWNELIDLLENQDA